MQDEGAQTGRDGARVGEHAQRRGPEAHQVPAVTGSRASSTGSGFDVGLLGESGSAARRTGTQDPPG
ncbi:hypothetical protein GCM10009809_13920 [Isoptericola hypogeus]|uniref:Uncharacterized protein n=1 Tax=Isoptericola hypogeus TaxID=300179 RepID=A0ABN2J722_9MICO